MPRKSRGDPRWRVLMLNSCMLYATLERARAGRGTPAPPQARTALGAGLLTPPIARTRAGHGSPDHAQARTALGAGLLTPPKCLTDRSPSFGVRLYSARGEVIHFL
jgi:hypothetical protein